MKIFSSYAIRLLYLPYQFSSELLHRLLKAARWNIWREAATCDALENCSVVLAAVNLPENPPAGNLRHESCRGEMVLKNGLAVGKQSASHRKN
jgi:hypothetical protein